MSKTLLMKRWASAELTLHEEGSMFGSSIASSQSSRGEVLSVSTNMNLCSCQKVLNSVLCIFLSLQLCIFTQGGLLVAVSADSSSLGARIAGSVYLYYV